MKRLYQNYQSAFEIRAMINPRFEDGQYNWGFTEEKYWAYRIELFDGKVLWGYVDREDTYLQRSMLKGSELSRKFC